MTGRFFKFIVSVSMNLVRFFFSGIRMLVTSAASLLLGLVTVLIPLSIVLVIIFALWYYLAVALDGLW